ncbi:MAG: family 20 glycosylhydrolase [Tidjanibacter sp.]|nr:family 20 glycosylhydrolase [Tidjanibacter sp.]
MDFSKGGNILGIQANMWTERVDTPNRLDYLVYPRMIALAENAWTQKELKDIDSFDQRLKEQFILLRVDDIYFNNPFDPSEHGEPPF